ncbi:MAG: carbon storage regulator [Gemmatimonadales bacterium]|nr:carbon storage regulator [Gemmatimonadales bacterium]
MLVLNRKAGEAILIAGGIRVVVVAVDRRGVRLGIEAPADTGILREELHRAVARANIRAATNEDGAKWVDQLRPAVEGERGTDGEQ